MGGGGSTTPEFMRSAAAGTTPRRRGGLANDGAPRDFVHVVGRASASPLRSIGIVLGIVAITGMLLVIVYVVLSNTSAFTITSIDADDTEHIAKADIARLANVAEGTTLLSLNEEEVRESLKKNPWVGTVELIREFPDRLRVVVTERTVGEVVVLGSGGVVWCLGTDDVWIEPLDLSANTGQTVVEAALDAAISMGALLVVDVPVSVSPQAGAEATDEEIVAVRAFRQQLSQEFLSQVVQVSAPGPESISCMLDTGVVISFGAPTAIASKEAKVRLLLSEYPNQLTYINVRVDPPAVRKVNSDSVQEGTGVLGQDGNVEEPITTKVPESDSTSPGSGEEGSGDYDDYQDGSYDDSYGQYDEEWYSDEY